MAPVALFGYPTLAGLLQRAILILMIITAVLASRALLHGLLDRYHRLDVTREIPLTSFFQVISVMVYLTAGLLIFGIILDRSPLYLLSGFGAIMAILTIVFRDPLLGLMAGVQLTSNKLVARGDLIELPKYDASGEVLNVALTTVTIRNADQSITTVPTYALISESFKNWRGIEQSGMRQIRRAILFDAQSIRFCSQKMLVQIEETVRLAGVEESWPEGGNGHGNDGFDSLADGASPTNLGLFRAYVVAYLRSLPQIREDELLMVRQLAQTPKGLPLEIFAYSSVIDFARFEALQASIFEHIIAKAGDFDLLIYQDRPNRA
jgi:miniconductance mechanosensitive channel